MFDNVVTRSPPGRNNEGDSSMLSDMYVENRVGKIHEYTNDFDDYLAAQWTVTLNGGAVALAAGDGGVLNLTSAVSANTSIQDNPGAITHAKNFRLWQYWRASIDSLLGQLILGIINVTAAPFTSANITDGAWFSSAPTTGALSFNIAVGGVITTVAMGVNLVAGQQVLLAAYYDGANYAAGQPNGRYVAQAQQYINGIGSGVNRVEIGAAGAALGTMPSTFPAATVLAYTAGVLASTAVARVLSLDTMYVAKDRGNINTAQPF